MRTPPHGPVRLGAPGVVLRAYAPGDVPDLEAAFADAEIARWSPAPSSPRPTEEFARSRNDWSVGDHASWAVAEPGGRLVGSVSVHKIDRDQRDAQMGYWIAPWARGQGYAVRAAILASQFALTELGLLRLALYHAVANPGSCAVATAAGFRLEGTMRESYRYADGVHHDEHVHGLLARDLLSRADARDGTAAGR